MQLLDNQVAGLDLSPGSDRNVIDHIRIEGGGVAVRIEGNENILRSLTLHDIEGILVRGGFPDDPEETPPGISLTRSRVEDTRGNGIVVVGFRNTIARNVVVRSTGDGIVVSGGFRTVNSENVVSNNRVSFSGGQGLRFGGIGHTVFRNVAKTNEETGFLVEATGSTFERNHGLGNGRFGIEDTTAGDGTAGTANAYASNLCHTANALGRSSPAGLCR